MKKLSMFGILIAALFLLTGSGNALAATTNITLDPNDWIINDDNGWAPYTANYTATTVVDNFRITRTVAQPGTGWSAHLRTEDTYNYQDSVLRFKWKVNGQGQYCHASGAPDTFMWWGPTGRLSTHHVYSGSHLVSDDIWVYTEVITNADKTWTATTGYNNYGLSDISTYSGTLSDAAYAELGDTFFRLSLCDNYAAGAYIELAEATITSNVPIPGAVYLLGCGLIGMLGFRRKSTIRN